MTNSNLFFLITFIGFLGSCVSDDHENDWINEEDQTITIPVNALNGISVDTVCFTDENGLKQGKWEEKDTVNSRIKKEYIYRNDTLNGYYLEYKTASSDTLIFGNYKNGEKDGTWTFWLSDSNVVERTEIYESGTLVQY